MGRFGDLFKKSDGKSKAENPYAQPPVDQSSPPPQYGQYNQSQYNDNRYATQQTQGPPSGLPAGPRPGGLPSRVAPGPSRTDTWESNRTAGTAPPQYSEQTSPPPPSYQGSTGTFSGGKSPAFTSNTASPSLSGASPALSSNKASPSVGGGGFPREKYGAQDGFGRNRFEPSNTSPHDRSAAFPSQRQGGYGGLDTESGGLFANYQPPSQRTPGPSQVQAHAPYSQDGAYSENPEMTEEERQEAEADRLKALIQQTQMETEDSADRSLQMMYEANQRMDYMLQDFQNQEERLDNAERNLGATHNLNDKAKNQTQVLKHVNRPLFKPGWSRSKQEELSQRWAEQEVDYLRRQDEMRAEQQQRNRQLQTGIEDSNTRVLASKTLSQDDYNKFAFEDDDGEQRERLQRTDEKVDKLLFLTQNLHQKSVLLNERAEQSNARLNRMQESAERARDDVVRNQAALRRAAKMD